MTGLYEIKYEISWRKYETREPSLTVNVYVSDKAGTLLSDDPYSTLSHLFYILPEFEVSERRLASVESSLRSHIIVSNVRRCDYEPKYPATREQIIDLFCRGSEYPISADAIEAVLGIPASTTWFFNHSGKVPAADVLRELRRRLITSY
jgi:hypothetical protein